jgi:hypothetical protein
MVTAPTAHSPLVELLVGVPALVCVGRHDLQAPSLDNAAIAAALPAGRLEVFERSGGYPFVEEPGRAIGAFVDPVPDPPRSDARPWSPAAMPTTGELFMDNLRRRRLELARTAGKLAHPMATVRLARRGWPAVREAFLEARAPRTSLSRRVGWHRRFALVRSDLDLIKRVAHAHDATVNDVLMAVLAGGLRDLLVGRGERVDGLVCGPRSRCGCTRSNPGRRTATGTG